MRPTYAEIRLDALVRNHAALTAKTKTYGGAGAALIAVIKADAYGHGLRLCGRALAEAQPDEGAEPQWFGVTSVEEALAMEGALGARARRQVRLLVMSGFFPGEEAAVVQHGLRPQVWESYHGSLLDAAARRMQLPPQTVGVHLEVDTGMSRQGVAPGEALAALLQAPGFYSRESPVFLEGVMTHFSSPEELASPVMEEQMRRLRAALAQLAEAGMHPRYVHAGNTANAVSGRGLRELGAMAAQFGAELLVRPGLALYGVPTRFAEVPEEQLLPLEPVLSWKTQVTSLREVGAGTAVGYNETFQAGAEGARLALLPVGYADGYNRLLSNRGWVLIGGKRVPVAGRVSMDQVVVDVSGVAAVELGQEVVLLGTQGAEAISAQTLADWCGTIPYEVLCGIGRRVPRIAV